jgi:hypothetical protein
MASSSGEGVARRDLGATLPWRGRVAERSEAGWGDSEASLALNNSLHPSSSPHPARLRCASLASAGDPPPPGEGGTECSALIIMDAK